jgi:ERCC4-type nuclease
MSDIQRQQADYLRQRRDGDREARFKIHRNIPKITAEGAVSLLDEFDAFETTFARTNPQSAKDWAITLMMRWRVRRRPGETIAS